MGWEITGIMEWSGKFLIYAGVSHWYPTDMGNILYIEYFTIYSSLFLNLEVYFYI